MEASQMSTCDAAARRVKRRVGACSGGKGAVPTRACARAPPARLALLGLGVLVVAQLAGPLEAGAGLHAVVDEALHHIPGVHIHGAERDEPPAVVLAERAIDELNQVAARGQGRACR